MRCSGRPTSCRCDDDRDCVEVPGDEDETLLYEVGLDDVVLLCGEVLDEGEGEDEVLLCEVDVWELTYGQEGG